MGVHLSVHGVGVGVGVGLAVGVGVGVWVAVGVGVGVWVAVGVGVGVGVEVGAAGQYLPPVFTALTPLYPPHTIISVAVRTAL